MSEDPKVRQGFRLGDRVVLPELNEVRGPEGTVRVHPRAMDVLVALAAKGAGVASKDELLDTVWTDLFVGEEVLSTAVWELRRALGDDARSPRFIRTVPRRGYGLVSPPRPLEDPAAAPRGKTARGGQGRGRRLALVAAAVLALAGVGLTRFAARFAMRDRNVAPIGSLAVLPIGALSGDSRDEALAAGLTDTLITDLAHLEGVRVVSRTTVQTYRERRLTVPEIGDELDVDAVVEGTLSRQGDRIVLNVQLIDARSEAHLWARTYERRFADLLDLQVEVARSVGAALSATIEPSRVVLPPLIPPEGTVLPPLIPPEGTVSVSKGGGEGGESLLLWRFPTEGEIWSSPLLAGDRLLVGNRDGSLYALSVSSGEEHWQASLGGGVLASPVAADGTVFVGARDGYLYAIDLDTGDERWRQRLAASIEAAPAWVAGRIVAADESGQVAALDPESGRVLWKLRESQGISGVADGGDVALVSGWDGVLFAFDAVDGRRRWRFVTGDRLDHPAVRAGDQVFVAGTDDFLYSLNAVTGEELWRVARPQGAAASAWRDRLVVGSSVGEVTAHALDTGELLWSFTAREIGSCSAVVHDGVAWVASDDRNLYALDPWSGAVLWRSELRSWVTAPPAVTPDRVVLPGLDGALVALRRPSEGDSGFVVYQETGFRPEADRPVTRPEAAEIVLLDPRRGRPRLRWAVPLGGAVDLPAAAASGSVFIGVDHDLVALGLEGGEERWRVRLGGYAGTRPLVVGPWVVEGSRDGSVRALDRETGEERWRFMAGDDVISTPVTDGEILYFGSRDRFLYAVELATGRERWRRELGMIQAAPALADGVVFAASRNDSLHAVAAATGEVRWSAATADWVVATPLVWRDRIFAASCDGTFQAFDRAEGGELWRHTSGGEVWFWPAADGRRVVYGSADRHLYAVDPETGRELWRRATGNRILSSVALWGDLALVGSHDRRLWGVEVASGRVVFQVQTGGTVSNPTVYGDQVFFGSFDGHLYCLDLGGARPPPERPRSLAP